MRVLVACEFSGTVRDAFAARGHDAWSCDLLSTERPGNHIQDDVLKHLEGWDLMIAHPPCTYLTCAGNKWFGEKYRDRFPDRLRQMEEGAAFFMRFATTNIPKVAIENPIGRMSSIWRKADQIIQPYQFGHSVRKATCLWLTGLPPLVATNYVSYQLDHFPSGKRQSRWHTETGHIKDAVDRSKARSRTLPGVAAAMAAQWG
jgi:hypothetical protein